MPDDPINTLRAYQRHWMLRTYGEDGQVVPECLAASRALSRLVERAQKMEAALVQIADPGDGYTTGEGHARSQEISRAALADNAP